MRPAGSTMQIQQHTHCQYVSVLPSLNSSTPFPGLALVTDHAASPPNSRSCLLLLPVWEGQECWGSGEGGVPGSDMHYKVVDALLVRQDVKSTSTKVPTSDGGG